MSEIRYDRFMNHYVIIAPERLHRPDATPLSHVENTKDTCPFCEGNEAMTPHEIYAIRSTKSDSPGWKTRVVPNLYKAVAIEAPHHFHHDSFSFWDGFGAHEVIIDTPSHKESMCDWTREEMLFWFKTLAQRVGDLRRDHRIMYLSLFKNEGYDAGSTMNHCHTQIIGLPLIPTLQRELLHRQREYFHTHHHALLESIIRDEENAGVRIIDRSGSFVAYCPYASEFPFEVMIASAGDIGQIDTFDDAALETLSSLLSSLLYRLKQTLNALSFNVHISTPPLGEYAHEAHMCRFFIRLTPRLYRQGGFEVSTHMMINPVSPELAAQKLREVANA